MCRSGEGGHPDLHGWAPAGCLQDAAFTHAFGFRTLLIGFRVLSHMQVGRRRPS